MNAEEIFLHYTGIVTKFLKDKKTMYNITQRQFADILGISQSTMCRWLSGHYNFKLSDLNIIEQTFGIDNLFAIKEMGDKTN
jgi:transcriptional regulator with XRE-family HTH domain